jgi:D-amino-acid oxidase
VVGCGVSGLSCGIRLLEQQFQVTIVARDLPPQTTSNIAAAIWYPYQVQPADRALIWGQVSLEEFYELAARGEGGVSLVHLVELFNQSMPDPWWQKAVRGFNRLSPPDLPSGYQHGFLVEVPIIETQVYLPYLMARFQHLGGQIEQRHVSSLAQLSEETPLIINCAGLGAGAIAHDPQVYPIRGQIVRVAAVGLARAYITEANPEAPAYIIPRQNDCILGGTAQPHDWNLDADEPTAQRILTQCRQLAPALRQATVLEHLVGLRPGRTEVRLESEWLSPQCAVVHNYGHGGAGFTLSWGCAQEVVELAMHIGNPLFSQVY